MAGSSTPDLVRKRRAVLVVAVAALCVAAVAAAQTAGGRREAAVLRGDAAVHYSAWALYRNLALWFGKAAMRAELAYWEAVNG